MSKKPTTSQQPASPPAEPAKPPAAPAKPQRPATTLILDGAHVPTTRKGSTS